MKSEHGVRNPAGSSLHDVTLDVLTTRFNIRRIRLGQLLIPLTAIVTPLATRSMGPVALVASVLLSGVAIWSFVSARTKRAVKLCLRDHALYLGSEAIHTAASGTWSWMGERATLFLPDGNVAVRARSRADAPALQSLLRSVLGTPLKYRRRGSLSARITAASALFTGFGLTSFGFAYGSVVAPIGLMLIVFGGAALGALSQNVLDFTPNPNRRD